MKIRYIMKIILIDDNIPQIETGGVLYVGIKGVNLTLAKGYLSNYLKYSLGEIEARKNIRAALVLHNRGYMFNGREFTRK